MHLAGEAGQVVDVVEGLGGDDEVDRGAGDEPQLDEFALVALDPHFCFVGAVAQRGDAVGRRVDRDRFRAGECQRDGVGGDGGRCGPHPEFERALTTHVAAETQLAVVGDTSSEPDTVHAHSVTDGEQRWAHPALGAPDSVG